MAEEGNKVVDLNSAYRHKVDAKGRMSLPSTFRKVLSTDLVVTRNPKDECLYVFEPDAFNAWVAGVFEDKFEKFDRTNDLHVRLRRKLKSRERLDIEAVPLGDARFGSLDVLEELYGLEAVGIDKEVVVVGNTGYFEIWDAKRYDAVDDETDLGLLFD